MKITTATAKGQRSYQEDRFINVALPEGTLLGVFDGHGGPEVAQILSEDFESFFAFYLKNFTASQALHRTIYILNTQSRHLRAGSTLSVVFIPKEEDLAVCAVLGDSPIIIRDAEGKISVSPDHNVRTNLAEAKAAKARGGFISNGYLFASYRADGLQMARALGDAALDKVLSRVPDIYGVVLGPDSFVLVATDGAFDPGHYDFDKAAGAVVLMLDKGVGVDAQTLVDRALAVQTGDNVTCILARMGAQ